MRGFIIAAALLLANALLPPIAIIAAALFISIGFSPPPPAPPPRASRGLGVLLGEEAPFAPPRIAAAISKGLRSIEGLKDGNGEAALLLGGLVLPLAVDESAVAQKGLGEAKDGGGFDAVDGVFA